MAKLSSTHIYGDLYVDGTISGALSGNASTATTLQTARTINGTSFNGSANITTANWGTARNISIADSDSTNTGTAVSVNGSGNVTLKLPATIKATLSGNAATATKATQDSAGQQINTTYIKGLSVSGKTITYTKGDGTTGTITTQDTNTTYSAATTSAAGLMSAADKTKLDGIATSANNYSHPNSGATAGSYGPSANASPAHSGTFSVPYITINAAGHITSASTKTITLPADNNTDTKVTYTLGTTTKYYMGGPTATATGTGGITFDTGIYATTTAGQLSVGSLQTRGNITTSGNGSHAIGSTANRFSSIYGADIYAYDANAQHYASLRTTTVGTADTQGVGRLIAGNSVNAGTAGNAKGQVLLYGTNTGYTAITPGNNTTSNITITLPSAAGTLARTSDNITGSSASCTGNAATATKLATARSIALGGLLSGSASFDGSAGITISASIAKPSKSGDWWSGGLVTINTDGVMEVGKYIDLHHTDTTTKDFSTRIQTGGDNGNTITLPTSDGTLALTSHTHSYAASSHTHSYLALSGGTLTGPVTVSGESKFHNGTYSDPWSGTGCAIKATGNIGLTGAIRANGGVATLAATNGVATSDGATYVANLRYANSRGYCDLGSNTVPGRLYIRSGQGTAGSGVCVECAVTNGKAYVQYLSPEAGTIALTNHLSDRTKKENIVYVGSKDSEFTNKDFYNFIRDDLGLATYNYNEEYVTTDTHTKLNFIAQDILYDIENNCENKVGNLIVQTENAMETQGNLRYDPEIYTSVIAGALKEAINKIEELEDKNKKLEERLAMLEEKFSALENK